MKWYGKFHMDELSFDQWTQRELDMDATRWLGLLRFKEIYDLYCDLFGSQNVKVFLYEQIRRDAAPFISQVLGKDPSQVSREVEKFNSRHQNVRRGKVEYSVNLFAAKTKATHKTLRFILKRIPVSWKTVVRKALNSPVDLTLGDSTLAILAERYFSSYAQLEKQTGLPLKEYGYY